MGPPNPPLWGPVSPPILPHGAHTAPPPGPRDPSQTPHPKSPPDMWGPGLPPTCTRSRRPWQTGGARGPQGARAGGGCCPLPPPRGSRSSDAPKAAARAARSLPAAPRVGRMGGAGPGAPPSSGFCQGTEGSGSPRADGGGREGSGGSVAPPWGPPGLTCASSSSRRRRVSPSAASSAGPERGGLLGGEGGGAQHGDPPRGGVQLADTGCWHPPGQGAVIGIEGWQRRGARGGQRRHPLGGLQHLVQEPGDLPAGGVGGGVGAQRVLGTVVVRGGLGGPYLLPVEPPLPSPSPSPLGGAASSRSLINSSCCSGQAVPWRGGGGMSQQ